MISFFNQSEGANYHKKGRTYVYKKDHELLFLKQRIAADNNSQAVHKKEGRGKEGKKGTDKKEEKKRDIMVVMIIP